MSKRKYKVTNKESLEVIKYFLSLVDTTEDGKMFWKKRNETTNGNKQFNGRHAGKELTREIVNITYKDIYYCFSRRTVEFVLKHDKLPIGKVGEWKEAIYPDNPKGLMVYNEFLKNVVYNDTEKCFYWKPMMEGAQDKRFNGMRAEKCAGRKVGGFWWITNAKFTLDGKVHTVNLLHALWLLKKGVPSELRLYFIDNEVGLMIENISDE